MPPRGDAGRRRPAAGWAALALIIAAAGLPAHAQDSLSPLEWRPPRPGLVMVQETTTTDTLGTTAIARSTLVVAAVADPVVTVRQGGEGDSAQIMATMDHGLVPLSVTIRRGEARAMVDYAYDRQALAGLWPLMVGDQVTLAVVETAAGLPDQAYDLTLRVEALEPVLVGDQLFPAARVLMERSADGQLLVASRAWYAPVAATVLRSETTPYAGDPPVAAGAPSLMTTVQIGMVAP